MFKRGISADRLKKAADQLGLMEKQSRASSLKDLQSAFTGDVLENSRIRSWNRIQAELDAASLTKRSTIVYPHRRFRKRLLVAVAVLVLLLGMTLAVSAGAREMVVDFVRQIRGDDVEYAFYGDSDSDIDPSALPSLKVAQYYPEFALIAETAFPDYRREYYTKKGSDEAIEYICTRTDSYSTLGFSGDIEKRKDILIHGYDADLYEASGVSKQSNLIWIDSDLGLVFVINSTLSEEEILDLAESLY